MIRQQRKPGQYRSRSRQESNDSRTDGRPTGEETAGDYKNSLIADMAKGFVEAQAKISNSPDENTNREMLQLLQKISLQLDNLQKPEQKNPSQKQAEVKGDLSSNNAADTKEPPKTQSPPELQTLFGQLLAVANQGQSSAQPLNQQQDQTSGQNFSAKRPQEAAQALAQAQYELSQELEASLAKLKQVIAESEKLAGKISNIIDSDGKSQ